MIRKGSVSKDLHDLAPLITERNSSYICLCTDDHSPLDIGEHAWVHRGAIAVRATIQPSVAAHRLYAKMRGNLPCLIRSQRPSALDKHRSSDDG